MEGSSVFHQDTTNLPMNHFTKYCNKLFVGCTNAHCTFAHTPSECRWGVEYAEKDVTFTKPEDANESTRFMLPEASLFPTFVITLPSEEEDDKEEEDDEKAPVSMSLGQITEITKAWQNEKLTQARWIWLRTLAREHHRLTDDGGEQDMDLSE